MSQNIPIDDKRIKHSSSPISTDMHFTVISNDIQAEQA